ncbi:hypothetical protein PR048_019736 [Dryococelus australis]|uniref:Ig-like domain-containing protein n=1 Tax=Dryococelus australis TaxID=614101 RepID=A0ABQ9H4F6_9NEOP|nr:hypothetical protein PR048_019736 [Dryococelus australis]
MYRYVQGILRPCALRFLVELDNPIFQQDYSRTQKSRVSNACLRDVNMLPRPARSRYLLPIEKVLGQDWTASLTSGNYGGFRGSAAPAVAGSSSVEHCSLYLEEPTIRSPTSRLTMPPFLSRRSLLSKGPPLPANPAPEPEGNLAPRIEQSSTNMKVKAGTTADLVCVGKGNPPPVYRRRIKPGGNLSLLPLAGRVEVVSLAHCYKLTFALNTQRLACSPPTKAIRVRSPSGSQDFCKWESCRTMPLVGEFSRGLPFPPPPTTSITLIGSRDLAFVPVEEKPWRLLRVVLGWRGDCRWYRKMAGVLQEIPTGSVLVRPLQTVLRIPRAQYEDSARYVCKLGNAVGEDSRELALNVVLPLSAHMRPQQQGLVYADPINDVQALEKRLIDACTHFLDQPGVFQRVRDSLRRRVVDAGSSAYFNCSMAGGVEGHVSWLKDGRPLSDGARVNLLHGGRTLAVRSVRKEDRGMYQCVVRHSDDSAQASGELALGGQSPIVVLAKEHASRELQDNGLTRPPQGAYT